MIAEKFYDLELYDSSRNRIIPVAIYEPKHLEKNTKIIIFNHGYGKNNPNSYKKYSYLTKYLAEKGYYVISIQHELPNDSPLAMTGAFMETRLPNWERGLKNILFVVDKFKELKSTLNWNHLTIIGHSNGGDMAILFTTKYPNIATKIISLDHLRMIIPRCENNSQIYTLRASDTQADKNVIPTTSEEQKKYKINVIKLNNIKHGEMDDKATKIQQKIMLEHINFCLNE